MAQWSFKDQRELIKLAMASVDLETIAARLKRSNAAIVKMAAATRCEGQEPDGEATMKYVPPARIAE
jgi:hypothetical protein